MFGEALTAERRSEELHRGPGAEGPPLVVITGCMSAAYGQCWVALLFKVTR